MGRQTIYNYEPLYRAGLNDMQIAKRLGCTRESVSRWRRQNKLDPNYRPISHRRRADFDKAKAREMYDAGKTDTVIGRELGVSHATIKRWREALNLASHTKRKYEGACIYNHPRKRLTLTPSKASLTARKAREMGMTYGQYTAMLRDPEAVQMERRYREVCERRLREAGA